MNLLTSLASLAIAIAAVLTFYTALLHLTRQQKSRSYLFRVVRDLLVGLQTLQLYFITRGLQLDYPFLLYLFVTLLFLAGPLNYMRYYRFFYPGGKIPTQVKLQLLPALIVLIGESWFYFGDPAASRVVIRDLFAHPTRYPITYVILAGVVVVLVQYGMLLRLETRFVGSKSTREPVLVSSGIAILTMVNMVLIAAGFVTATQSVMDLGILSMGIAGITYLLFENRYPDFYQQVAREQKQERYKRSLIQGLSRKKIVTRLRELMEEEKIYRQFDLKLGQVAAMLYITPHQLSEFVNDSMGMNFASYINRYRVEEAKQLLVNEPEETILTIGFQVGFGSKQSFNMIFKQETGMTPSEYRRWGKDKMRRK